MNQEVSVFAATAVGGRFKTIGPERFWPVLFFAVSLTILGGVGTSAAEKVIKVGVYDFAPLVFVGEDGKPGGLFIDVLEHIARKEGWRIEYVPGTWDRSLNRIETGEIDLITCIGYSKERTARLDFTKQFLFLDWGRVYEKIGAHSESVFDLEGKKVAVLKGSIYTLGFKTLLEQFDVKADLVEKDDYRQVFRAVEDGDVLVGINGRVAGIFMGSDYKIRPTEILFSPVKIGFAVTKGTGAHILSTLDEAIAELKADKNSLYYQRLKYWTEFYAKRTLVSPWLLRGLLGAGIVSLLSMGFVFLLRRQVRIRTSQLAQSNEALRDSEAKFRMFVERMPVITYTAALDSQSTTTYISPRIEILLGFSQADYLGDPDLWRKSLHDDDRDRVLVEVARSHDTGEPFVCEYRMVARDGRVRWFRDEAGIVNDDQDRPLLLLGVMVDITERKYAEEELQRSEALLSEAERVARIGNWQWDARTNEVYWSAEMYRIVGVTPERFQPDHRSYLSFIPSEDREGHRRKILESLSRKEPFEDEHRVVTPEGRMKTVWVHGFVKLDEEGNPIGMRGTAQDITERKRMQEQLEESEARVRLKLESILSPKGDIGTLELGDVIDPQEIQDLMNEFFRLTNIGMAIIDLKGKVLVGTGWQDICTRFHRAHPETCRNCTASDTELSEGLKEGEFKLYRCLNNMWDIATPIMVGGNHLGNLFLGQFLYEDEDPDYEIFRAQALRYGFDELEYLRALDRVPRWSKETVDTVMRFYARLTRILSRLSFSNINLARSIARLKEAEEAIKSSEEKYRTVVEESFDGVFVQKGTAITFANSRLHEMLGYEPGELEGLDHWLIYHPDHRDITRSRAQARLRGEWVPSRYEVNLLRKDGIAIPGEINAKVIRFDNEPRIQVWIRDLTEQKLLEEQLVEAQKMEAVGTLAGGIAHDFNNILHIIAGHTELLEMDLAEKDMQFEETAAIRKAAHRGADLVKQILTFSRRVEKKLKTIDLNEEVQDTERLLYRTIPKMIDIELKLEKRLRPVRADSTQVEQMLINLAVNAKDAMPDGGKLTIETRNEFLDEDFCRRHTDLKPGPYVLLKVSDTGHGMEEDVKAHIFEPFFTTKGLAEGTGLGLATVFGIVKMHGGHITCDSEIGKGTTFAAYFPVAEGAVRNEDKEEKVIPIAGGKETILVVDDEPMIRDLARRILENAGYSVLTTNSGREAIEIYAMEGSRISLVVLDLIMPEMGGKQCLEELLKIDPHVKALIASGFAVQGDTQTLLNTQAKGLVAKPFGMGDLLRSVRDVLDGSRL